MRHYGATIPYDMIMRMEKYLRDHWFSIFVLALVAVLSVGSFFIDLGAIRLWIEQAGVWAPVFYILAKTSTVVFAPLSGTALYVFSVPLFGFWKGVLYSFIGDFIGAVITFYLSRFFGRPVVSYLAGKKNMDYIESALEVMSTPKGFLSMRLAAVSMPEIASYAAGLTKINFWFFITVHMAVDIVPILVMTSPGLFFTSHMPAWVVVLGVIAAGLVTVISIAIFVFMLKRATKKRIELERAQGSQNQDSLSADK
jgi:uncharacterized membrane protein YdjX (TVP38/TMEM64 family)